MYYLREDVVFSPFLGLRQALILWGMPPCLGCLGLVTNHLLSWRIWRSYQHSARYWRVYNTFESYRWWFLCRIGLVGSRIGKREVCPPTHDFQIFPKSMNPEVVKISKGQEKFFTIFVPTLWEFWVIVLDIHSDKASDSALFFSGLRFCLFIMKWWKVTDKSDVAPFKK